MTHATRSLLVLGATVTGALVFAAVGAGGVTPDQLMQAGWECRQPAGDPTRLVCAPPGQGLPPRPGTPEFADRSPSYHLRVFSFATGEFIGTQQLLHPDTYVNGTPACPTQPGRAYVYVPGIDLWGCFHPKG
jgi:hypothetical protein